MQSPFTDLAEAVLRDVPDLDLEQKANLWDIFHSSKDANELAENLRANSTPGDVKYNLLQAKKESLPPTNPAADVMTAMSRLDPAVLDIAEKHPNAMKAFVALISKGKEL